MNVFLRPPPETPTRHRFTCEEFQRLYDAGVFPDFPDLELIEGDITEMPADGPVTIGWNAAVNRWLVGALAGQPYWVIPDKTLRVTTYNAPKPDFWVYPASVPLREVTAATALLAIEVADTSLEIDRDLKAPIYEKGGLPEYWIIDCNARQVLAYRLGPDGYGAPRIVPADEPLACATIPGLSLRLDALDLPA